MEQKKTYGIMRTESGSIADIDEIYAGCSTILYDEDIDEVVAEYETLEEAKADLSTRETEVMEYGEDGSTITTYSVTEYSIVELTDGKPAELESGAIDYIAITELPD